MKLKPLASYGQLRFRGAILLLQISVLGFGGAAYAQTDLTVYDEALAADWQDWSWATVDLGSTANAHTGTTSIAVTPSAWSALWLRHEPFDSTGYGTLTFWIHGGTAGLERLFVVPTLDDAGQPGMSIGPIAADTWQRISIPLVALAADNMPNFTGFWIQEGTGNDQETFYVDDIVLTASVPTIPPPPLGGALALYEDAYVNGWENWSWASVNVAATSPVNSGATSIAVDRGKHCASTTRRSTPKTTVASPSG